SHSRASEPIAIVGMAGVFPKSPDLETFWANLASSKDLISEVPADRWDWREYFGDPRKEPRKMNIKWGAFLTEIDKFDARFFNLPPREAELMDPQHRLMLQTVWKALDDAGHPARSLSGSSTGVFIGICSADYQELMLRTVSDVDIRAGSGTAMDIIPSRISFLLNLHGPSEISATACSSSLVAVHRAVQAIRHGECEQAIVGGVNLMITPTLYLCYGKAGMLAQDGQCKTFDHRANGYVRGEGAAAVLIKPLRRALADGDHVYGVIKGTAVNHAGHTRTFGAPSPQAEAEVIRKAITDADISPATINYIEAHGTGTPLGDPIEISGLEKAFREVSDGRGESLPAGYCAVASVKTNVGHMEAAAGIAGLVKVLLSMQHKKLPASRNFEKLNPYIKLEGTPFYVLDRTVSWEQIRDANNRPLPRRAGISSFGFGGVNAHVILEEFVETREGASKGPKPELVVLSARTNAALREYAQLMADWFQKEFSGVRNGHPEPAFAAIAFTLQVGRDQMPERLAVVAETPLKAAAQLRAWLQGEESQAIFSNKTSARRQSSDSETSLTKEDLQSLHDQDELLQMAALWISGQDIPWGSIRSDDRHVRLSMPVCPFARERYWMAPEPATPASALDPLTAVDAILDHLRNSRITADEAATLLQAMPENEIEP
ncbi:MAG: pksR, partial [Verrucomicrobiales bacterium]|nr:pksR [Verrucomicrobiales bacterium]